MSTQAQGAVVLLSGGLDSATTLAIAQHEGFSAYALTLDYGQRQRQELQAARRVAHRLGCREHRMVRIDLRGWGGSALTDDIEVPKDRDASAMAEGIPVTYVPARNTLFLSYALAWAETLGVFHLFIGANQVDYSGYPDCRAEFIEAFERLANLATRAGVERRGRFVVQTPLLHWSKAQIIQRGLDLGVPYEDTHSCYDPWNGIACGRCDACVLRRAGFQQLGQDDPIPYLRRF